MNAKSPASVKRVGKVVLKGSNPAGGRLIGKYVKTKPTSDGKSQFEVVARTQEEAERLLAEHLRANKANEVDAGEPRGEKREPVVLDPNDLPPEDEDEDMEHIFDLEYEREPSSEEDEEEVWNSSASTTKDAETEPRLERIVPVPQEPPKEKNIKSFVVSTEAKMMDSYTADVKTWVNDIMEDMHGNGGMRVVVSPSVRAREFMCPVGFGIGVLTSMSEVNDMTLPIDVFDPFRLYSGVYGVRVPRDDLHAEFYDIMATMDPGEALQSIEIVRDNANFQLTESFLGIFRETSASTQWLPIYWVLVRDGDTQASEDLYTQLETHKNLPFLAQIKNCCIKETREKASRRRETLAKSVYNSIMGQGRNEDINGDCETETTYHGIHTNEPEAAVVLCNGMAPVINKKRHFLLGDMRAGVHVLEGERSDDDWNGKPVNLNLMPCETKLADALLSTPQHLEKRFSLPEDFKFGGARTPEWLKMEQSLGRSYGMSEKVLEPFAVAWSLFDGHSLECSEYNDL